jgi:hypothetical protein
MPLYPALIWTAMQMDSRFAATIVCANEIRHHRADFKPCAPYSRPMMIAHALLLTIGVMAIGLAGQLMIARAWALPVTATIAALGVYSHAGTFIYMMTEALSFCLYSLSMLAVVLALKRRGAWPFVLAGVLTALLALTRPSFLALGPILITLLLVTRWSLREANVSLLRIALFAACFCATLLPWMVRNSVSVGRFVLTEEYGAQQIIERFGFNQMTLREGLMAFPAGVPQIGGLLTSELFGTEGLRRWRWDEPDGFYTSGMTRRRQLIAEYGRVGPIIMPIILAELRENWWRHVLTTIPIAWVGLWVGQTWGLLLIPVFGFVTVSSIRRRSALFLAYAAPALAMGLIHGAVANHNVRYNFGFIGPISVAAALAVFALAWRLRRKAWPRTEETPPAQPPG